MVASLTVVNEAACLVSISGDSPVTCTVSDTPPTASVRLTVINWPSARTVSSTLAGLKPWSVAVTT